MSAVLDERDVAMSAFVLIQTAAVVLKDRGVGNFLKQGNNLRVAVRSFSGFLLLKVFCKYMYLHYCLYHWYYL